MRTACSVVRVGAVVSLSLAAAMAQTATSRIVSAANAFLSTLDQKQRQSVLFAFDDEKQRARWSNLPTTMVPRAGLSMGELNAAQRSAALALVSSALSRQGFEKVQQIMEGDEVLKTAAKETTRCSARISITFPSWEHPPKRIPGCCSSAATIWRSISRSPASTAFSRRP